MPKNKEIEYEQREERKDKHAVVMDAVETKTSIIKITGYANAVATVVSILSTLGALWIYMFGKPELACTAMDGIGKCTQYTMQSPINPVAIYGMFGLLVVNIILFLICVNQATD